MPLSEHNIERLNHAKKLCIRGIKRFLTFILSHVGLTLAVAAYGMLGGIIFMNLEAPFENDQRLQAVKAREELTKRFLQLADNVDVSNNKSDWSKKAEVMLLDFQEEMYRLTKESGWDGMGVGDESKWSFAGALLYAVTVITTIGYGHIAPKTGWGRLVTILYAMLGIPLTLLCLRNIGSLLSSCVRLIYKYTCIKVVEQYKKCRRRMYNSRRLKYLKVMAARQGLDIKLLEGRPEIVIEEVEDDDEPNDTECESRSPTPTPSQQTLDIAELKTFASLTDMNDLPEESSDQEVRVPLTLTFLMLTGYIVGGAIMFGLWEKDWDYLIGSYFCFITLSTIGFGDFVPGTSLDSWSSQEKNIICSVYLLFGMAIMAMCFHLVQEEVKLKCRRLAEKVGLFVAEKNKSMDDA
ncbi:hypothetical protein SNE40_003832 [Patella caerulea]|uniref:Potassium channel domain-containing protein n=1 Tax=Patella caerulea TaxID=87958 RepID=A0AAN8K8T9_PATCE